MNEKETGELRRRLRPDRCAVSAVYGCYVNEKKEIAANFRQSLAMLPKEDAEAVLQLMRKTLSGGIGRNLLALPFSTGQVMDSAETAAHTISLPAWAYPAWPLHSKPVRRPSSSWNRVIRAISR